MCFEVSTNVLLVLFMSSHFSVYSCMKDTEFEGFTVPKGAQVVSLLNQHLMLLSQIMRIWFLYSQARKLRRNYILSKTAKTVFVGSRLIN